MAVFITVLLYGFFLRRRFDNKDAVKSFVKAGNKAIGAFWHQRILVAVIMRGAVAPLQPSAIISASNDGDFLATVIGWMGFRPLRGSSSFRGKEAMEEIIADLQVSTAAVHGVDGPTGPSGVIKSGIIRIAQKTGAAIFPMYVSAERCWMVKSWDRHIIPKPFSRVVLRWGEPFFVPAVLSPEEFAEKKSELEAIMRRGQDELDAACKNKFRLHRAG